MSGTDAMLALSTTRRGTYHIDTISMFPRDTFKGRANGMRKDLADMVAAMKPGFVRFPGGCFVEGEEIGIECSFSADGFANAIGADRSFVDAPRKGVVVGARLSELLPEE